MYGAIESKSNHKYPSVYREPVNNNVQMTKSVCTIYWGDAEIDYLEPKAMKASDLFI